MLTKVQSQILAKYPGLAKTSNTHRKSAIILFCAECAGGSLKSARACTNESCFLWPHRSTKLRAPQGDLVSAQRGRTVMRMPKPIRRWTEEVDEPQTIYRPVKERVYEHE